MTPGWFEFRNIYVYNFICSVVKSGTCWRYFMLQLHPSRCWNVWHVTLSFGVPLRTTCSHSQTLLLPASVVRFPSSALSVGALVKLFSLLFDATGRSGFWLPGAVRTSPRLKNLAFVGGWRLSSTLWTWPFLRVTPLPPRRTRKMTYLSYPAQGLRRAGRLGNLTGPSRLHDAS